MDIAIKNENGDTLYYNITSPNTVEVTRGENPYAGAINIPDTVSHNGTTYRVTAIGDYAFLDCTGLTSITIPNSVTKIEQGVFCGCQDLTTITIPNSVTEIGDFAFSGCTGFTTITIPNSVTKIGEWAFQNCTSLINITIPNSVTEIEHYTFFVCTSLTTITIPNSVTKIGRFAFCGCTSLTNLTIPNSVTEIGEHMFVGCDSLISITSLATEPPSVKAATFYKDILGHDAHTSLPLYVPAGSIKRYQAAPEWEKFTNIQVINSNSDVSEQRSTMKMAINNENDNEK